MEKFELMWEKKKKHRSINAATETESIHASWQVSLREKLNRN